MTGTDHQLIPSLLFVSIQNLAGTFYSFAYPLKLRRIVANQLDTISIFRCIHVYLPCSFPEL